MLCQICNRVVFTNAYSLKHGQVGTCRSEVCMRLKRKMRRLNDKNGKYAKALLMIQGGKLPSEVAREFGCTLQSALYLIDRAREHGSIEQEIAQIRSQMADAPAVYVHGTLPAHQGQDVGDTA